MFLGSGVRQVCIVLVGVVRNNSLVFNYMSIQPQNQEGVSLTNPRGVEPIVEDRKAYSEAAQPPLDHRLLGGMNETMTAPNPEVTRNHGKENELRPSRPRGSVGDDDERFLRP